ncbi:MAG: PilZ domain-containing protein [Thiogranum sp.]
MERRNHARVAVNLKAALLDDQAMPIGCRVRDVSTGGMLLQHERYATVTNFRKGDSVEVRLSIRQDDERRVIPLSMTVKHVEENGIGVEFLQPQSHLMRLVDPYRLDRKEAQQEQEKAAAGNSATPVTAVTSNRASRRRFAIQRARAQFAESMQAKTAPAATREQEVGEHAAGSNSDRRLFYLGLLSLVAAIGMLLFESGQRTELENRMSALESVIDRQVNALAMLRARLTPADTRTNELSSLNARLETLSTAFAALETRMTRSIEHTTTPADTPVTSTPPTTPPVTDRSLKIEPATGPVTGPAPPAQHAGSDATWVINLVSLYDKAAANRFAQQARAQGIAADTRQVSVKQRQVWRVQVGGFASRDEARTWADTHRKKLGLNSVWIFRKQGTPD